MHQILLPYGNTQLKADLSRGRCLGTIDIAPAPALANPAEAIRTALDRPIGMDESLFDCVCAGERVAILVSDSFRQTRADQMLPVLLDGLLDRGVREQDLSIVFSTGTHRGPSPEEQAEILGKGVFKKFRDQLFVHDPWDADALVHIGDTRRGTRVEINKRVHESDRIIVTGSVILHYFGGFGGGRKSVVPGIASARTIAQNHSLNLDPGSDRLDPAVEIGRLDGNPVAEDMLEATRLTHVDGIVNTVLNQHGQIAGIFAGELDAAHRAACVFAEQLFCVAGADQADLVIAASPNTRNFVQTHKALFNAWQALKPGGRIVLAAPCPEGLGGEQFSQWLELGDRAAIIAKLREHSEINGQTALSVLEKAPSTHLISELGMEDIRLLGMHRAAALDEALNDAIAVLARPDFTYLLMPSAAYTVPIFSEDP